MEIDGGSGKEREGERGDRERGKGKIDRGGNRLIGSERESERESERGGRRRYIKRDIGVETDGGHVEEREREGEKRYRER